MGNNLHELLLPIDDIAERVVLRTDQGAKWTREDLEILSRRLAYVLKNRGVAPGHRIAIQLEKSAEVVCLYLAVLQLAAVYLPINTAYTAAEVSLILTDAEPHLFITKAEMAGLLDEVRIADALSGAENVGGANAAAILYTSGTTGRPKGAIISHRNLAFAARELVSVWGINAEDVVLHALPIFHAHGLFIAVNTALFAKAQLTFLSKFSSEGVLDELAHSTVFMGVPTFYTRLLANPRLDKGLCAGVRLFTSGSAPLSKSNFAEFEARTGHAILERYGMTETTIIASNPLKGARIPGTVGFPLPGVEVDLREGDAGNLAPGSVGELVVRGPNVFEGYWRLPEKTAAEHTEDGFFRTGDLARVAPDGRITLVGRAKDLIISGGYNVYPEEVEAAIGRISGILDCAVVGVPHPDFGEGVIAVIEQKHGGQSISEDQIISILGTELARYKIPKYVRFLENLPRNALGKIMKGQLRDLYNSIFTAH